MQEYRFRESGFTIYITWSGEHWRINRIANYSGKPILCLGADFDTQQDAINFARRHYKIIRYLVITGHF